MSVLLRSGDVKDYTALGQDGQAVYIVASQLRDAIRFKRGRRFADYLAIPQRNDMGSVIDWYIPFEVKNEDGEYHIIPWSAATSDEKQKALLELDLFKENMLDLGKELVSSENLRGDQLLFSRLLYTPQARDTEQLKALRFPSEEHVYLVNDRPVITFWGFSEKNTNQYADPFFVLRPPISVSPSIDWNNKLETASRSNSSEIVIPVDMTISVDNVRTSLRQQLCLWMKKTLGIQGLILSSLLLLFGVGLLLWFLWSKFFVPTVSFPSLGEPLVSQSAQLPVVDSEERTMSAVNNNVELISPRKDIVADPAVINASIPSDLSDVSPANPIADDQTNNPAEVLAVSPAPELVNVEQEDSSTMNTAPPTLDLTDVNQSNNPTTNTGQALRFDSQSLRSGKVDFLNGNWSVSSGIQDKATGKPLKLNYQIVNGQGTVTLKRGDGVSCQGGINAKAQSSGITIANTGSSNCSDGSTYQLPNVVCRPDVNGVADCRGSYNNGKSFPISMKSN